MRSARDQAIAFSAVAQFAEDVHEIAATGMVAATEVRLARRSVLDTQPESAEAIYGGVAALRRGREVASLLLGGTVTERRNAGLTEVSAYIGNLLKLGGVVAGDQATQQRLAQGIESLRSHADTDDDVTANAAFAELYTQAISPLQPRVLVNGRPEHLRNPANVAAIRTLLLGGVRAAVLWQQRGGRIWRIVLLRQSLLREIRGLGDDQ